MLNLGDSATEVGVAFALSAVVIALAGLRLTICVEQIARVTRLGNLLAGTILIGLVTSLAGLLTSVSAAWDGHASLAVSNSLGGIAAQTTFLALADITYKEANLEHAAPSESALLCGVLLVAMLALVMLATVFPGVSVLGLHPVSPLLIVVYVFGMRMVAAAQSQPMWQPRTTVYTQSGRPESRRPDDPSLSLLLLRFAGLATLVSAAGWALAHSAFAIVELTGMGESIVGGLLTAVTTSFPELVVAIVAVRRGALALALGDILGGNAFDVLFLAAADAALRGQSIYLALAPTDIFWGALSILLTAILLLGMLRREQHGVGNIGFESAAILGVYVLGVCIVFFAGWEQGATG